MAWKNTMHGRNKSCLFLTGSAHPPGQMFHFKSQPRATAFPTEKAHVTGMVLRFPLQTLQFNFSLQIKLLKANLIKMTHGLECMLQTLILFTVLRE